MIGTVLYVIGGLIFYGVGLWRVDRLTLRVVERWRADDDFVLGCFLVTIGALVWPLGLLVLVPVIVRFRERRAP